MINYLNRENIVADHKLSGISKDGMDILNSLDKTTTQSFQVTFNEIINEPQIKAEGKEKEELSSLIKEKYYQKIIRFLYAGLILLVIAILLILYKWQSAKRMFIDTKLKLANLEKEEIKLNDALEEKYIPSKESQKYEALLETYFKRLEMEEKEKELNILKKEKELLDKKIDEYRKKLHEYENNLPQYDKLNIDPFDILIKDLSSLILKKCGEKAEEYLNRLQGINESFVFHLEKISKGSIFTLYLKYCICFVIGMNTKEISECFSVEPGTIHVTRSRIKKKLGLGSKDKLDIYLKRLIQE